MDSYESQLGSVSVDGKKLQRGFTTGTAAAAAAKAAYILLSTGEAPDIVDIKLFSGQILKIIIEDCGFGMENNIAFCSVRKYAGDDIDATNQMLITANVKLSDKPNIEITSGIGVGTVTRSGLQIEPGKPAINPKPLELIKIQFEEFKLNQGIEIQISAPDGEKIANKTFNPRLGIEGGISILGTTGIVEPMSEDAFKRSLLEELKQKKADSLCFTFGNMGEKNLLNMGIEEGRICICSITNSFCYQIKIASIPNHSFWVIVTVRVGSREGHHCIADCTAVNKNSFRFAVEVIINVNNRITFDCNALRLFAAKRNRIYF